MFVVQLQYGIRLSNSIDNAIYRDSTFIIAITIILLIVTTWCVCMRVTTHVGCAHTHKILPCELVMCWKELWLKSKRDWKLKKALCGIKTEVHCQLCKLILKYSGNTTNLRFHLESRNLKKLNRQHLLVQQAECL